MGVGHSISHYNFFVQKFDWKTKIGGF